MNAYQPVPPVDEFDDDEPGIFEVEDPEYEARLDAEADADIAAGRVISNEAMIRWLRSWRTPDELPPPQCGE